MYFPIMLNVKDKTAVVIGGGKVAYRKTKNFLNCGMDVKVVRFEFIDKFKDISSQIEMIEDTYKKEYLEDAFVVAAATSSRDVNNRISLYCNKENILCNVVDKREDSSYIVPAFIKRKNLVMSVCTMGKSPYLSSDIRKELEKEFNEDYDRYVGVLGEIRELVLQKCDDEEKRRSILKEIISLTIDELEERRKQYEDCSRI